MGAGFGQMALAEIAGGCREETGKFLRREPSDDRFCLELLRRAIVDSDQAAWQAAFAQYRGMVMGWIGRHPAASAAGEDAEYWTNRAFDRFWSAVGPERFAAFPGLAALLRYLKLCAHSVLLDAVRARPPVPTEALLDRETGLGATPDVAAEVLDRLDAQDLWRAVNAELRDEAERIVARLCLALDLKPREVYERHPERFASVADVYRVKRNLLDRLRRSPAIRALSE